MTGEDLKAIEALLRWIPLAGLPLLGWLAKSMQALNIQMAVIANEVEHITKRIDNINNSKERKI